MMKKLTLFLVVLFCATALAQDPPVPEAAGPEPVAVEPASQAKVEAPQAVAAPESAPDVGEAPAAEAISQPETEPPESAIAPESESVATPDSEPDPEPVTTPAPEPKPEPLPLVIPEPKPAPAPVPTPAPIPAASAPQGKQTVAIYMAGKEPHGAKGVHNILGGELARTISTSEKYTGVDRTEAIQQQLSREHVFQRSGAVDDDQIKSLGQQLGVQYLCISDINAVGNRYYLDTRLIDVVTAEIIRTVTANSNLKNADEMKRIARNIAYDLIETEKAAEQRKRRKKMLFYTAISADVLGAGMLAYGLIENSNMKMYIDGAHFSDAERAQTKRNAAYIIGGALLVSGVSIHILF